MLGVAEVLLGPVAASRCYEPTLLAFLLNSSRSVPVSIGRLGADQAQSIGSLVVAAASRTGAIASALAGAGLTGGGTISASQPTAAVTVRAILEDL